MTAAMIAFCACSRFSAWSNTTELGEYTTSSVISSPQWAAGQGHALPAGPLGRGDHRRGAVLAQLGGVRPGREPAARAEGDHGGGHPLEPACATKLDDPAGPA